MSVSNWHGKAKMRDELFHGIIQSNVTLCKYRDPRIILIVPQITSTRTHHTIHLA